MHKQNTHANIYTHTQIHRHMHTHMHTHMQTHKHTRTHIYIYFILTLALYWDRPNWHGRNGGCKSLRPRHLTVSESQTSIPVLPSPSCASGSVQSCLPPPWGARLAGDSAQLLSGTIKGLSAHQQFEPSQSWARCAGIVHMANWNVLCSQVSLLVLQATQQSRGCLAYLLHIFAGSWRSSLFLEQCKWNHSLHPMHLTHTKLSSPSSSYTPSHTGYTVLPDVCNAFC